MKSIYEIAQEIKGKDNRILLGVTGGIASGKTAVSEILEELGAPLIDLDIIARQVVEPGTVALENIIDYFGKQVLHEDESLDRKKLSNIIFEDMEKRKKLESFTHPPIFEEFLKQVDEIAKKTSGVIIQVSIPLLIEENLQFMFDKIVVVYISRELQVERLALRDGISRADASN
ncbi:MAG: dephospho-CoA kinase, partial [Desulfobacterales bacterium]